MFGIMTGDPISGFSLFGVFKTDTEAVQYAVENITKAWWLIPISDVTPKEKKRGRKT